MRPIPVLLLMLLFFGGCVHGSRAPEPHSLPEGAPEASDVLADLSKLSEAIWAMEGTGMVRLKLPGVDGIQNFRTGFIQYKAPDTFFAQGRKPGFVVRVYIEGDRFLLETPSEKSFFIGTRGDQFNDLALDVAPSQIFRELFFLDLPQGEDALRTEVVSYEPATGRATLAVFGSTRQRRVSRRIDVINEGGWRVSRVSLFDRDERLVAEAVCDDWAVIDGVVIASEVTATYPVHGAEMGYKLSETKIRVNEAAGRPMKPLDEARAALIAEGYREVRGVPRRESTP